MERIDDIMKRIMCFVFAILLLPCLTDSASAAVKEEIEPLYDNINTIYACISIDESTGIATCMGSITAKNTYPVEVDVRLQQYYDGSWHTLKTWSNTGTMYCASSHKYAVYSGYTYRVYVTGYVYNSSGVIIESASGYHATTY